MPDLRNVVTLPETLVPPAFQSFTLAILLFFVGQKVSRQSTLLRRYSIPEPVVGGFLCACVVGAAYLALGLRVEFDLGVRDMLLLGEVITPLFREIGLQLPMFVGCLMAGMLQLWMLGWLHGHGQHDRGDPQPRCGP